MKVKFPYLDILRSHPRTLGTPEVMICQGPINTCQFVGDSGQPGIRLSLQLEERSRLLVLFYTCKYPSVLIQGHRQVALPEEQGAHRQCY
jgi:hypothetical protein